MWRFTEIQRNAGLIVESCAEIRVGHTPVMPKRFDMPRGQNVKLIAAKDEADTVRKILETMRTIRDRVVLDPVGDVQVIVGTNDTRHQLNREVQREFNSSGKSAKGNPFRVADKIICLKNGTLPREDRRGESFVANGEQGIVTDVFENRTIAQFADPLRVLWIPRSTHEYGKAGCHFDLGYAITCHKSQGSEWPLTIIGLPSRRGEIGSREWLYTSLSRARMACILVGRQSVIESMVRRPRIGERQTGLVELLANPAAPPVVEPTRPQEQTHTAGDGSPTVELPRLAEFLAAGKSARVRVGDFVIERNGRGFKVGRHSVIEPDGRLRTSLPGDHEIIRQLQAIDESPEDRLAEIGRDSGHCVFCGRELSDPLSVLHGYGPRCAANNGLPWGVELEITR